MKSSINADFQSRHLVMLNNCGFNTDQTVHVIILAIIKQPLWNEWFTIEISSYLQSVQEKHLLFTSMINANIAERYLKQV